MRVPHPGGDCTVVTSRSPWSPRALNRHRRVVTIHRPSVSASERATQGKSACPKRRFAMDE